ncbi:MAG: hypothetical protein AAB589_00390 [Patescibacteria group bacterium]
MAKVAEPTQDFVPIREIRDGVVVLKNNSLRLVLIASALNFALKSEDEKEATILQYQNFLNSLDFQIQLFIQSRKLDIKPYLMTLQDRAKEQTNELLQIQTREYIDFIKNFTLTTDVMTKTFFVVVPYDPPIVDVTKKGFLASFLPGRQPKTATAEQDLFLERRTQLEQRAGVVVQGLGRFGIRAIPLGTEELVELYFKIFNPGEASMPSGN